MSVSNLLIPNNYTVYAKTANIDNIVIDNISAINMALSGNLTVAGTSVLSGPTNVNNTLGVLGQTNLTTLVVDDVTVNVGFSTNALAPSIFNGSVVNNSTTDAIGLVTVGNGVLFNGGGAAEVALNTNFSDTVTLHFTFGGSAVTAVVMNISRLGNICSISFQSFAMAVSAAAAAFIISSDALPSNLWPAHALLAGCASVQSNIAASLAYRVSPIKISPAGIVSFYTSADPTGVTLSTIGTGASVGDTATVPNPFMSFSYSI